MRAIIFTAEDRQAIAQDRYHHPDSRVQRTMEVLWLKSHGLSATPTGGGDVAIKPIKPNSAAVLEFQSGQIDGGWEPEPYATEMVLDGGTRLVNEASLWPGGKFVTTNLVVTQSFLKAHPSAVNGLLKGQIEANSYINANRTAAATVANTELTKVLNTGQES